MLVCGVAHESGTLLSKPGKRSGGQWEAVHLMFSYKIIWTYCPRHKHPNTVFLKYLLKENFVLFFLNSILSSSVPYIRAPQEMFIKANLLDYLKIHFYA